MAKYDRSKFKAKRMSSVKERQAEIDSKSNFGNRVDVLKLKTDGSMNKLRIAPAHPKEENGVETFWNYPSHKSFLPLPKKDEDGNIIKENGVPKLGSRPIFSAIHHCEGMSSDPVSIYIDFIRNQAYNEIFPNDKDKAKKFLNPIYGWRAGNKYNGGINPSLKIMVYGWLNGKFGRIELSKSVADKINDKAMGFDPDAGALATDPFTDPDTGVGLLITFDKDEKNPSNKYKVEVDMNQVRNPIPLTDEQLDELGDQKPLHDLYHNVYSSKEFELQLQGLQNFEEQSAEKLAANGFENMAYEVFSYDEFHEAIEAISVNVPDAPESNDDEVKTEAAPVAAEETVEDAVVEDAVVEAEEGDDDFTYTSDMIDEMGKGDIKALNKEKELGLIFNTSHKLPTMRDMIKKALGMEVAEEESEPTPEPAAASAASNDSEDRLAKFKAKMKNRGK